MIAVIAFIGLLAVGVPIALMLAATGMIHAVLMDQVTLFVMLPQRLMAAVNSTHLMAIPLFMLAGELMSYGGITEKLCDMCRSIIGFVKGGMAYVTVLVGTLLGMLLGSATASSALLSRCLKPELDKEGYDGVFSACMITATSILGPIIPPSIVIIIYGVAAQMSIGKLFLAGFVPGVLIAAFYCLNIFLTGRSKAGDNWIIREKIPAREAAMNILRALPALLVPFTILGGIMLGITTPTESAVSASVIAIILGVFVYRKLKIAQLPEIFFRAAVICAPILLIVGAANILAWTMALDRIPQLIANAILSVSRNKYVLLFMINILLLFVGMILETTPAIIILVPVLLPVINAVGIDPLHFGMVMCVNLCIGFMTPPVGLCLYTTSSICGIPVERMIKPIWKWVGMAALALLLITYIPALVTFLPNVLMK